MFRLDQQRCATDVGIPYHHRAQPSHETTFDSQDTEVVGTRMRLTNDAHSILVMRLYSASATNTVEFTDINQFVRTEAGQARRLGKYPPCFRQTICIDSTVVSNQQLYTGVVLSATFR